MKVVALPSHILFTERYRSQTIRALSPLVRYSNQKLGVNLSQLVSIEKDGLIVLAAQLEKSILSNRNTIFRNGSWPSPKSIRKLFTSPVGSVVHVNRPLSIPNISDSEKDKLLIPSLVDSIVKDLRRIGIKEYFIPFNVFLTELIGNAVEHGIQNRNINWWLTHEINHKEKCVTYTFVDMGLGIVKSHRKAGLPLKYFFKGGKSILLDSFLGLLGSSTKILNRGKGLPQLRGMIENGFFNNFVIITNKTCLKFVDGAFTAHKNPNFVGTYYSWTIDQNSFRKWKSIK